MTREQLLSRLLHGEDSPLPLGDVQAIHQAHRLRSKYGLSYNTLAFVMGEYHGSWHGSNYWRDHCRRLGAPVSQPWNVTPQERRKRAAA